MPFCPSCQSEYRTGFEICATCEGDVALVDELPEATALTPEDDTTSVGIVREDHESGQLEVEGRTIDLSKVFSFKGALELRSFLQDNGHAAIVREIEGVAFPGGNSGFEVHVRTDEAVDAEALLLELWSSMADAEGGTADAVQSDECPACGAHVPLEVEECPDCGLVVGVGEA